MFCEEIPIEPTHFPAIFAPMIRSATGFDFTFHARRLCDDMACRLPELAHIRMDRVAVSFCQTRKAVSHGMYAALTPVAF